MNRKAGQAGATASGLAARPVSDADNPQGRLLRHLGREFDALSPSCVRQRCQPPTGWPSRPSAQRVSTARSGANQIWNGASHQERLMTVLRTARQQHRDPSPSSQTSFAPRALSLHSPSQPWLNPLNKYRQVSDRTSALLLSLVSRSRDSFAKYDDDGGQWRHVRDPPGGGAGAVRRSASPVVAKRPGKHNLVSLLSLASSFGVRVQACKVVVLCQNPHSVAPTQASERCEAVNQG